MDNPLLRVGIISDIQGLPKRHDWGMRNFARALDQLKQRGIDTLLTVGDIAESGNPDTYALFWELIEERFGKNSLRHFGCEGNHDIGNGRKTGLEEAFGRVCAGLRRPAENPYREEIVGFDFVTLAAFDGMHYAENDLAKLEALLKECTAAKPGKPVFLLTHLPPAETMSGSFCKEASAGLRQVLNKFPQVISFSGHTHYPLEDERCIWQGEFTAVTTATLAYGCMNDQCLFNPVNSILPYAREAAQFLYMEVYSDRVELHRIQVLDECEIGAPWVIRMQYEPEKAVYSGKRAEKALAPEFPKDAELLTRYDYGYMFIAFDVPKQGGFAQYYDVELALKLPDGSFAASETIRYVSDFYRQKRSRAEMLFLRLPGKGMIAGTEYRIRVYPVESFGRRGAPLEKIELTWHNYPFKDGAPLYPQE